MKGYQNDVISPEILFQFVRVAMSVLQTALNLSLLLNDSCSNVQYSTDPPSLDQYLQKADLQIHTQRRDYSKGGTNTLDTPNTRVSCLDDIHMLNSLKLHAKRF